MQGKNDLLAESFKICPICSAANPPKSAVCTNCGASLAQIEPVKARNLPQTVNFNNQYDFRYGETDLYEGSLKRVGRSYLVGLTTIIVVILVSAAALVAAPTLLEQFSASDSPQGLPTPSLTVTTGQFVIATVTPGQPTPTQSPTPSATFTPSDTPTPAPCLERVLPGDSLILIAIRCGHRSQDVIPLIVEINGLQDASRIREGQVIEVPWPTATEDPNAVPTETPDSSSQNDGESETELVSLGDNFDPFAPTATYTLLPGIMWHVIQRDETISSIIVDYNADVKVLSELNPEVDFARCEFGNRFGGPECIVQLFEGQQIRVPAPTSTPTIPPTPSGSETPTPTATATFNAPSPISPGDSAYFAANELVTLRWIPSGVLSEGQTYRVVVKNETTNEVFSDDTFELFYILPLEWQGRDGKRQNYTWTVSVIDLSDPDNPVFTTAPRSFIWQAQLESVEQ